MKSLSHYAGILFLMTGLALPAAAAENHGLMQERVKVALNEMVQDVKAAKTPDAKRQVMTGFLGKVEDRAALVENFPFLSSENRAAITVLKAKFASYQLELQGTASKPAIADKDLDAFAGFVQQDLEQAEASWGNGGIYLSTGAVIIILLIIILIT